MSESVPVLVFDSNPDALDRRIGALLEVVQGRTVLATTSRTAVVVLAHLLPPQTPCFIDLCVTDRLSIDRPGERLIERVAGHPAMSHVRPIAWSAHVSPDVIDGVRTAGGAGFVTATLRRAKEADELSRAIAGETIWPAAAPVEREWEAWFARTYAKEWQPWMEPMLVRLASGDERRSVAADLVDLGAARSENHAAARMRELARIIAGEHSNAPSTVARQAALVLAQLASRRVLAERPSPAASLERGASAIRAEPSLAVAAGLTTPEITDLLALDLLIAEKRASSPSGAGAPPADRVRTERAWAAGRRALEYGASQEDVDAIIAGILARVDGALLALEDAQEDALAHPWARLAAGLLAVERLRPDLPIAPELHRDGDAVRWQGRSVEQVALQGRDFTEDAAALLHAIDLELSRPPGARDSKRP